MVGTESPLRDPWAPCPAPSVVDRMPAALAPGGQRKPGPLGFSIFISLGNKTHRSGNRVVRESEQPSSQGNPQQGLGARHQGGMLKRGRSGRPGIGIYFALVLYNFCREENNELKN